MKKESEIEGKLISSVNKPLKHRKKVKKSLKKFNINVCIKLKLPLNLKLLFKQRIQYILKI